MTSQQSGGAVTTTTVAEAAIDAGLEAIKIRGERPRGGEAGPLAGLGTGPRPSGPSCMRPWS